MWKKFGNDVLIFLIDTFKSSHGGARVQICPAKILKRFKFDKVLRFQKLF